uniref:Uncharacterized protein n=1 Tax=Oryza sativa subsp. japonica TaxID=39947 RepID=Q67UQ5_ORYSJ|nr:hypothetical protein [Oryza sativa Japonica Group]
MVGPTWAPTSPSRLSLFFLSALPHPRGGGRPRASGGAGGAASRGQWRWLEEEEAEEKVAGERDGADYLPSSRRCASMVERRLGPKPMVAARDGNGEFTIGGHLRIPVPAGAGGVRRTDGKTTAAGVGRCGDGSFRQRDDGCRRQAA